MFKLIRIDDQCSSKIQLSTGVHVIGRGKFLHVSYFLNNQLDRQLSKKTIPHPNK